MEDTTALQIKITDLENQVKILSNHVSENAPYSASDRVKLNVGGHIFETTNQTLRRYPGSMLGAMFSGKFYLDYDAEGVLFIDRDGPSFRCILNFLRDGVVPRHLPKSDLEYLLNEAEYFGIKELIDAIHKDPINASSSLEVEKVEQIPDFVYEFGVPRQQNDIYHYDTMRGYMFTCNKPMLLENVQLLVSHTKPFSCEAYFVEGPSEPASGVESHVVTGSTIRNIVAEEPKWVTSHFSPAIELAPNTYYNIFWSFEPKIGYIFYAENGSNPQRGRDVGPFTVYGRKANNKWTHESNYYNIRMRVTAKEVPNKEK